MYALHMWCTQVTLNIILQLLSCAQSVQHENSYRDADAKYCYGASPPSVRAGD